jgi:hypothetical protein
MVTIILSGEPDLSGKISSFIELEFSLPGGDQYLTALPFHLNIPTKEVITVKLI